MYQHVLFILFSCALQDGQEVFSEQKLKLCALLHSKLIRRDQMLRSDSLSRNNRAPLFKAKFPLCIVKQGAQTR